MLKFFKTKFAKPLKNVLFLNYYTSNILLLPFLKNVPKIQKDFKKTKDRYENSTVKVVLKRGQTFAKIVFIKSFVP